MSRQVNTSSRIAGLKRRDIVHESAGFLCNSDTLQYDCAECRVTTRLTLTQLGRWVIESRGDLYEFDCEGCGLHVEMPVQLEEIPSGSCEMRVVLGAELREFTRE